MLNNMKGDLAASNRLEDMSWKVDMLFRACIRGMMEVMRLSIGEDGILALLPQSEKTLYKGFDSAFLSVRYDSQMTGQSWLVYSQSYRA
jgi:hypothetical protein